MVKWLLRGGLGLIEAVLLAPILVLALVARLFPKRIDVGLGPEPLIANIALKRALAKEGYSARTFVTNVYHTTQDFDVRFASRNRFIARLVSPYLAFAHAIFSYRILYIYFTGGPLLNTVWLWRLEPGLLRIAGLKTVVMPYGSDIYDLDRSPNDSLRQRLVEDYPALPALMPRVRARTGLWTRWADHILAGADWVDYLARWDTLMLSYFAVDTELWRPADDGRREPAGGEGPLKVLHAPNHRHVKGTDYIEQAISNLTAEGLNVELMIIEGAPNETVRRAIAEADVVADQLIIGWYAMFAIEGMAMGKPVICYLRPDLLAFYEEAGLLPDGGLPIVNAGPLDFEASLRRLASDHGLRKALGRRGREFILERHSLEAVGKKFAEINRKLGVRSVRG